MKAHKIWLVLKNAASHISPGSPSSGPIGCQRGHSSSARPISCGDSAALSQSQLRKPWQWGRCSYVFMASCLYDRTQNPSEKNKAISQLHHTGLLETKHPSVFLPFIHSDKIRADGASVSCPTERRKSDGYEREVRKIRRICRESLFIWEKTDELNSQ